MEAIRFLFHHPSLTYQKTPPMFNSDGTPNEESIRIAEEMLRQKIEKDIEQEKKRREQES